MKIIVAHPGRQHSFQTAIAMRKKGYLYKYITSVYNKRGSLTNILTKVFKGDLKKKISGRRCMELEDSDVVQINEFLVIITLFMNKIPGFNRIAEEWNRIVESSFYRKVMHYALKHNVDAIIVYNGYAKKYFERLDESGIVKIIDVSIAQREYIRDILDQEIKDSNLPIIRKEHFSYWNKKMIKNDIEGCSRADYFLVPSEFVKVSLMTHGIPEAKIRKVPYGVDVDNFTMNSKKATVGPLKLIYVGGITYRKGLHRLLDIVCKYNIRQVELFLVGAYNPASKLYMDFKEYENIHFLGFVTRDKLVSVYNEAHVFVLPSFAEGMAMVGLEAMACGLPLICTRYSGVNDTISNGVNGFVYDAANSEELQDAIEWFMNNREKINDMGLAARNTSLQYTWNIYHQNVADTVCLLVDHEEKKS